MKDSKACIEAAARFAGEAETMLRHGNYAEAQATAALAGTYAHLAVALDTLTDGYLAEVIRIAECALADARQADNRDGDHLAAAESAVANLEVVVDRLRVLQVEGVRRG